MTHKTPQDRASFDETNRQTSTNAPRIPLLFHNTLINPRLGFLRRNEPPDTSQMHHEFHHYPKEPRIPMVGLPSMHQIVKHPQMHLNQIWHYPPQCLKHPRLRFLRCHKSSNIHKCTPNSAIILRPLKLPKPKVRLPFEATNCQTSTNAPQIPPLSPTTHKSQA